MRETGRSGIAAYLKACVEKAGGSIRKVEFSSHRGAPDYLVWIPSWGFPRLIETKSPTGKLAAHQKREHERLRKMKFDVRVVATKEAVDRLIFG